MNLLWHVLKDCCKLTGRIRPRTVMKFERNNGKRKKIMQMNCTRPYSRNILLPRIGILPGAKFTFRPSLAFSFSYICCVTARQSSSARQPNVVTFSRRRHLYSAGWPSLWASAHILVRFVVDLLYNKQYRNLQQIRNKSSTRNRTS